VTSVPYSPAKATAPVNEPAPDEQGLIVIAFLLFHERLARMQLAGVATISSA